MASRWPHAPPHGRCNPRWQQTMTRRAPEWPQRAWLPLRDTIAYKDIYIHIYIYGSFHFVRLSAVSPYCFLYFSKFVYMFSIVFYIFLYVSIYFSDSPGRAASIFITTNKMETATWSLMGLKPFIFIGKMHITAPSHIFHRDSDRACPSCSKSSNVTI